MRLKVDVSWIDWFRAREEGLMSVINMLTLLVICLSLSSLTSAAEFMVHSSEQTMVILTPDVPKTGYERNWVRRSEREIDPSTRKELTVSRKTKVDGTLHPPPDGSGKKELIDYAKSYLGSPYRYGGNNPSGIDCSGFVKNVYGKFGVKLPRTARQQYTTGKDIDRGDLSTGDLIFFGRGRSRDPSHVGIFLEDDKFIHSSARKNGGVRIDSLGDNFYRHSYLGGRKLVE